MPEDPNSRERVSLTRGVSRCGRKERSNDEEAAERYARGLRGAFFPKGCSRRGMEKRPTVFLRAVSADQCGFSRAVISRRHPKLVESLIASKLLLTALFSFLSRQLSVFYLLRFLHVNS